MKHTNKNHKRRNNKKRQTKKYKGGVGEGFLDSITSRFTGKSSDNNENSLEKEAREIFNVIAGPDAVINSEKYPRVNNKLPGAGKIPYGEVDTDENSEGIDFNEFLPLYYFLKASGPDAKLDRGKYATLQGLLPDKFGSVDYEQVDPKNDGIDFNKFLPLYYFLKVSSGDDAKITTDSEYNKLKEMLPGAKEIDFLVAAQGDVNNTTIDFHKFLPLYYFAKVNANCDKTLNEDEYTNRQKMLPDKFSSVAFTNVNRNREIGFNDFLKKYNELYPPTQTTTGGGRRRRKRSTRNKRKSNKKRRTVKRRKSAKKSHRRK